MKDYYLVDHRSSIAQHLDDHCSLLGQNLDARQAIYTRPRLEGTSRRRVPHSRRDSATKLTGDTRSPHAPSARIA
ncbi:hypothetical protein QVD17_30798 [Tagetes erecta]|uniref:Uncharacterized protein n=1 Tax=Tagetes erecta TaxID=13708 RepID=A0AAD8K274_TARER|nr:hypothetical protein QVD17_30798 [Tagetes erecta]